MEKTTPDDQSIKDSAFRLMSYRPRSQAELIRRLTEKGYDADRVHRVVADLTEKGYIDDKKFGLAYARDQVRLRKIGPTLLSRKLNEFGLEKSLVQSILFQVYEEWPVDGLIRDWLAKKGLSVRSEISGRDAQKIITFLQRKGYSWERIQPIFNELQLSITYERR